MIDYPDPKNPRSPYYTGPDYDEMTEEEIDEYENYMPDIYLEDIR